MKSKRAPKAAANRASEKVAKVSESVGGEVGSIGGLSGPQIKAIDCLMSEKSVRAAAECAGVARSTIYEWLALPAFSKALADAQRSAVQHAARRLSAALERSVTTVVHLAESSEDEPTRLRAAMAIPDMLRELRDYGEFGDQLTAIEAVLFAKGANR